MDLSAPATPVPLADLPNVASVSGGAMAAREVPNVASVKIVDLGSTGRVAHGGADATFEDEGPFRSGGVPMQLARHARFEAPGDAGDALGDGQLHHGRLLAEARSIHLARRFLQSERECRQVLAREERVGDVVLASEISAGVRHRVVLSLGVTRALAPPMRRRWMRFYQATPGSLVKCREVRRDCQTGLKGGVFLYSHRVPLIS
jgi:hypothetical protein